MRKYIIGLLLIAVISVAIAGSVYQRETFTLSASGSGSKQLDYAYSGIKLQRIWVLGSATNQTVAFTRVDSTGAYTNTVCSVVTSNSTTSASFTADYMLPSDTLYASGSTNATVMLEFEVQKH